MSDPGPYEDISGQRSATNSPPGQNPPNNSDLPSSMASLVQGIQSLVGEIRSLPAQIQQAQMNVAMMSGKTDQYTRMILGGASPHFGNSGVPNIRAVFPPAEPGGEERVITGPSVRGQTGALPGRGTASMLNLRQRAARAVSQGTAWGPRLDSIMVDGKPTTVQYTGRTNADGSPEAIPVKEEDKKRLEASERRWGAVQGAVGKMVAGEGLGGIRGIAGAMLPEAAVPWVGAAVAVGAVGLETAHMVADQRAKNAQFQSVMGGSNFSAFGQRASQAAFGLRNIFTLGGGQAEEAFMTATRYGMRGAERNQALNMAVSAFNSMGMSVAQSLEAMNIQAQTGYENFSQLEKSLKAVSKAAKDTSQNAEAVRQSFIDTYGTMAQTIGGGAGTEAGAAAIAGMKTSLGRQFAGINFSGMADQTRMYMMAANSGMNYNQFAMNVVNRPGAFAGAANQLQNQILSQIGGVQADQAISSALRQSGYKPGAGGRLSPGQIQALTSQVAGALPPAPAIKMVLSSALGIDTSNMSDQAALEYYVNWRAGQTQLAQEQPAGPRDVSAAQRAALRQAFSPEEQRKAGTAAAGGGLPASGQIWHDIGAAAKGTHLAGGVAIDVGSLRGGHARLREQYLQQVGASGKNSTIIDQMLKDNANWGRLFTVQTADGPKTVNFQDLISNYSDQAASGGVSFASGKNQQGSLVGISAAQIYGGDPNTAYTKAFATGSAKQGLKGKERSDEARRWEAKEQGRSTKGKTDITISATPQLQQLLGFAINGQSVTASTSTSLVPTLGQVNSESLAGSSPGQYGGQ